MNKNSNCRWRSLVGLGLAALLAGCASVGDPGAPRPDPLEPYNRTVYQFNETLDRILLKPVAQTYQELTPEIVDNGISNFFGNLGDVVVVFNDVLQLKGKQALQDTTRIFYNSTLGVLGFFDVASAMGLPKHNEDFGQTLGYWGVGEGYFLVLPVLGFTSTRDVWSYPVDGYISPVSHVEPDQAQAALRVVEAVDIRADLLQAERAFMGAALDPYSFAREAYFQRRENLVYDGNPPRREPNFEDDFQDDFENDDLEGDFQGPAEEDGEA
ncbi:MAG: VacJ family lipoprotein [Candidatus Competibacteraceae bacterium]|nr:VacJ family lipoprotein [Candidatus Competibacteraceae bacterium]